MATTWRPTVSELLCDRSSDGVWRVTLNRPDKLNALTRDMIVDLLDLFVEADSHDGCSVVLLTGAGRGFCSGWDLDQPGEQGKGVLKQGSTQDALRLQRRASRLILRIAEASVPVIAAVNGWAAGGGFAIALAC